MERTHRQLAERREEIPEQDGERMTAQQQAFLHDLYIEMYAKLLAYAKARTSNQDDAEDAVQETFRVACARITVLQKKENPGGWLMNVLKYVLLKQREAKTEAPLLPDSAEAMEAVADPHATAQLRTAEYEVLLGKENFALLNRFVLENSSSQELASELGIKEATCRKRLERLRVKMKTLLAPEELDGKYTH